MEGIHILVINEQKIVECVLYHTDSDSTGRIVQLAMSEEYRGQGFGRKLIHALEQEMSKKGVTSIYLFAREEFQGFYERLGFHYEGESFERMGAPHKVMRKLLLADVLS